MKINNTRIQKLLSSRSMPTDMGTITAIGELVQQMVKEEQAIPVQESRLGVYLNHNFSADWPLEERHVPGPVPVAIKLLDEVAEHRKAAAAAAAAAAAGEGDAA